MTAITDILNVRPPKVYKSKLDPVECSNPELIAGVEIETEKCSTDDLGYSAILEKIWQVKTDGSLRGRNNGQNAAGNAYEFISKPAPLKILIPELELFFKTTKFKDDNFTDRCSIHVHTNITDLTVHQIGTLFLTYSVVEDLIFKFINTYRVAEPRGKYRDTNIYCVPWNQCRMNFDIMSKMFEDAEYAFKQWQKYTALNILPTRTIGSVEWRHMHGTADMEKLRVWLNMIGRIYKYSTDTSFEDAVKIIKNLNDNSAYQQYFTSVFGNYLEYTPEAAKALESGVVYAKYSMFHLKDYTVQKPDRTKVKAFLDDVEVGVGIEPQNPFLRPAAIPNPDPAGGVQIARREAARREPQRARDGALGAGVAAGVIAAQDRVRQAEIDARALSAGLTYPLRKGVIVTRDGALPRWGIQDALGRMRFSDGTAVPMGSVFDPAAGVVQYVQGLSALFWKPVRADWRPDWVGVAEQGGF